MINEHAKDVLEAEHVPCGWLKAKKKKTYYESKHGR